MEKERERVLATFVDFLLTCSWTSDKSYEERVGEIASRCKARRYLSIPARAWLDLFIFIHTACLHLSICWTSERLCKVCAHFTNSARARGCPRQVLCILEDASLPCTGYVPSNCRILLSSLGPAGCVGFVLTRAITLLQSEHRISCHTFCSGRIWGPLPVGRAEEELAS